MSDGAVNNYQIHINGESLFANEAVRSPIVAPVFTPEGKHVVYPEQGGTETVVGALPIGPGRVAQDFTMEGLESLLKAGVITMEEAGRVADAEAEKLPVGSFDRRLMSMAGNYYDLVQRNKALEHRVQEMAEQAEARFTRMDQEQLELQTEREFLDADTARRFQELEDRITETHDHLTEHMANLQPLVVSPPPETSNWTFYYPPTGPSLDEVVNALSKYSDAQLAAMVTAATARREMLKAMEAA